MSDGDWANSDQRDYMNSLAKIPLDQKCWCGWFMLGDCYNCSRNPKIAHLTCADKAALMCPECNSAPWAPGEPINHIVTCKQRTKP